MDDDDDDDAISDWNLREFSTRPPSPLKKNKKFTFMSCLCSF